MPKEGVTNLSKKSVKLGTMATGFLQNLEGVSTNTQLEQIDLQKDIASLEEVEEIVKSEILKMRNDVIHDVHGAYSDNDYESVDGDDVLGMTNLQISDLVDIFDNSTSEDVDKQNFMNQVVPQTVAECCDTSDIGHESPQMHQSAEELLDDITLVINNDKKFINSQNQNASPKELGEVSERVMASTITNEERNEVEHQGLKSARNIVGSTTIMNKPSALMSNGGLVRSNKGHEESIARKDYNQIIEKPKSASVQDNVKITGENQNWSAVDKNSCQMLITLEAPNVSLEESVDCSKTLDVVSENSLVERSCFVLETLKNAAKSGSNMGSQFVDDDVTVDGEDEDTYRLGSVELCRLNYDENLMSSFDELHLHQGEDSELVPHGNGSRGRPARSKVVRPAIPCRIEPKVSQLVPENQPSFMPPQLISDFGHRFPRVQNSAMPTSLQPHLGQVTQRFPVVLHNNPKSNGQLFLEVYPEVSDHAAFTPMSDTDAATPLLPSALRDTSRRANDAVTVEKVAAESKNAGTCNEASPPAYLIGDARKLLSKPQHSLEVDGPTHHRQARSDKKRNDNQMSTGVRDQSFNNRPFLERPYTVQAHGHTMMSSDMAQGCGYDPRSFAASDQSLIGPGQFTDTSPAMWSSLQNSLENVQAFSDNQCSVQTNQRIQKTQTFSDFGNQASLHQQLQMQTGLNYLPSHSAGSFPYSPYYYNSPRQYDKWPQQPNVNASLFANNSHFGNNDPARQAYITGATTSSKTGPPGKTMSGLPNMLADPRSKRWRTLLAMGNPGLKQVEENKSGGSVGTLPQSSMPCPDPSPAASYCLPGDFCDSMIQLSPPVELPRPEHFHPKLQKKPDHGHVKLPVGVTPGDRATEKTQAHSKSVPQHSSRSSNKGPDIPVPVVRSEARVQTWLKNNIMFRPDLDSGTYDPSDHSLKHEPSLPESARPYQNDIIEQALPDRPCEVVGIFDGKSMLLSPQPKPVKKRNAKHDRHKELGPRQVGRKGYPILSSSSAFPESSYSSGNTDSSTGKAGVNRNDSSSFCPDKDSSRLPGNIPPVTETLASENISDNLGDQITGKVSVDSQQMYGQIQPSSYPVNQVDDRQAADLEIAEHLKQFQQCLTGILSSSDSSHVLSELGQYVLANEKLPLSGGSGNNQSSLKMEATVSGSSKSSFDASKYITPSDIESLENKKTQVGKNSLDGYLDKEKNYSNDSMGSLPNTAQDNDVKPLADIPLKDIAEVIGSSGDFGRQPSLSSAVYPQYPVTEHRQKAVKRRPNDQHGELAYQNGQAATLSGTSQSNQSADMSRMLALGMIPEGSSVVNPSQNYRMSSNTSHLNMQPTNKMDPGYTTLKNISSGDKRLTEVDIRKAIPQRASWPAAAPPSMVSQCQGKHPQNTSLYDVNTGIAADTFATTASYFESCARPLNENFINHEVVAALKSGMLQSQNTFQDSKNSNSLFDTEMNSNSSLEIPTSHGSISDQGLYMDTSTNQSGPLPASSIQFTDAQHLFGSPTAASTLLPPSSSSSLSSTVPSVSRSSANETLFKKPQSVSHNPGVLSTMGHKTGHRFPSMEGDSDVSMASENSLSGTMAFLDKTVKDQLVHRHDQQQFQQQLQLHHFQQQQKQQQQQQLHQQQQLEQLTREQFFHMIYNQDLQQLQNQTLQQNQMQNQQLMVQLHQQQQIQNQNKLHSMQQHLGQKMNTGDHFAGSSSHYLKELPPSSILRGEGSQPGAKEDPSKGHFVPEQPRAIVPESESMSNSISALDPSHRQGQQQFQQAQQSVRETFPSSAAGHRTFMNSPVDQNFSSRMSSIEESSSDMKGAHNGNNSLKSSSESQLQQYLNGAFPSLDFGDVYQEKFSLSLRCPSVVSPSSGQNKSSVDELTQAGGNESRLCSQPGQVHSAERSREEADSDLSVFSVGSDEEMLNFQPDNDGETLLHLLCDLPQEMREKISSPSSIPGFVEALNLQNKNQETALHIAVKNEDLEVVKFLVSHGADVNALCLSSQKGIRNKTSRVVCRNETVQQTALHEAVELGNTEIVRVLLTSKNVRLDSRRPDSGLTPLMLALQLHRQSDRKDIVLELIKHETSLSLQDTIQGKTPLMYAIQSRDVSLVEHMLHRVGAERARALVNERAKNDMTCLHFAAELRLESSLKRKLLRCIIVAGGDASAKNSEGETPRDWARVDINEVLQNLARLSSP